MHRSPLEEPRCSVRRMILLRLALACCACGWVAGCSMYDKPEPRSPATVTEWMSQKRPEQLYR